MDLTASANQFLDTYGLIAVFGIVLLKEIGIPVPIPSDLIMLGAAARAAQGRFPLIAAFVAILVPMIIGGVVQYGIAKGPGRQLIYRLGNYVGLTKARLDRAMDKVRQGGSVAVGVGLTTPGVRIAIVPASGLADMSLAAFVPGLIAGSAFFLAWHFAIGFLGGALLNLLTLPSPALIGIVIAVIVLGALGWVVARRVSRRASEIPGTYAAWADASCPACVAITLIRERS